MLNKIILLFIIRFLNRKKQNLTISQVNAGLGKGEGLDIFTENIVEADVINVNNKKEVNKKWQQKKEKWY